MAVRVSDLKVRDVVDVSDGRRLGFISDLEIDLEAGRVTAIVVPGPGRLWGLFGREPDYVIPWGRIRKIGADVILVDISTRADPLHGEHR